MSGPEPMKPDDQLLDEFLAGQGAVRERYRAAAREQAPAEFDAAILQAARAAATAPPRRQRRARWQAPMATAAVLMLSLGVFLQVQRDPVAQREVLAPAEQAAAPSPAPENEAASRADGVTNAPEVARAREQEASPAEQPMVPPAPPPPPKLPPSPKARRSVAAEPAKPVAPLPAPPAPAAPVMAAPAAPVAPEGFAADAAAPPAGAAAEVREAPRESVSKRKSMDMRPPANKQEAAVEEIQRQESAAFAAPAPAPQAAPRSKSAQASVMPESTARRDAPAVTSEDVAASAIERWAQRCDARGLQVETAATWRGLAVQSFAEEIAVGHYRATLRFAAGTEAEAIVTALRALAASETFPHPRCDAMTRELRPESGRWALVCECAVAADD